MTFSLPRQLLFSGCCQLDPFNEPLRQLFYLRPDLDITVAVLEVCKSDYDVISDRELLRTIEDDSENKRVISAAVLACGARRLRDARERCKELLGSSHHGIRLNAAIALLNMRVDADVMQKI